MYANWAQNWNVLVGEFLRFTFAKISRSGGFNVIMLTSYVYCRWLMSNLHKWRERVWRSSYTDIKWHHPQPPPHNHISARFWESMVSLLLLYHFFITNPCEKHRLSHCHLSTDNSSWLTLKVCVWVAAMNGLSPLTLSLCIQLSVCLLGSSKTFFLLFFQFMWFLYHLEFKLIRQKMRMTSVRKNTL